MTQSPFDRPEPTGYERPEAEPYGQPDEAYPQRVAADPAGAGFVASPDETRPTGATSYGEPGGSAGTSTGSQTSDVAKQEAADLKDHAQQRGQQVADTAKDQAGDVKDTAVAEGQQTAAVAKQEAGKVVSEATSQAKDLIAQSRSELSSQMQTQQQRLAGIVHGFADELGSMASASDQTGPLTDLAHTGARRGGEVAHWLETNEPAALLDQVRSFARRRPVAFLAGSVAAGVVVGRLTRGLAADAKSDDQPSDQYSADQHGAGASRGRATSDDSYPATTMPETGTLGSDMGTGYAPDYTR